MTSIVVSFSLNLVNYGKYCFEVTGALIEESADELVERDFKVKKIYGSASEIKKFNRRHEYYGDDSMQLKVFRLKDGRILLIGRLMEVYCLIGKDMEVTNIDAQELDFDRIFEEIEEGKILVKKGEEFKILDLSNL